MKGTQVFSGLLDREILQILFRPTLQWFTLRSTIASQLEKAYGEWRSDKNGNVALFSPKEKEALEIYTKNVTSVREDNIESDKGLKDIETIFPLIVKESSITEIHRIGCRRSCIFHTKFKFVELTDLIYRRLFSNDPVTQKLHNGKVSDLAYVLNTEKDGVKTHIQMGAVLREEGLKQFDAKFDVSKEPEDDNNLYLDIDISISSGLTVENTLSKLEEIRKLNHTTMESYLSFLST